MESVKKGIFDCAKLVGSTAGAYGHTVIFDNGVDAQITKDGVSVARFYEPADKSELAGVHLLRQACNRQLLEHGDGTTATAVMMSSFVESLADRKNMQEIRKISESVDEVCKKVFEKAEKVDEEKMLAAAMVSSNFDERIARAVCSAIQSAGEDGYYSVEESYNDGINSEIISGFIFQSGYVDSICVNMVGRCEMHNPIIFVKSDVGVKDISNIVNLANAENRPLLVIGNPDDQVLESCSRATKTGFAHIAFVVPYGRGRERDSFLSDVKAVIEADENGIGTAKHVVVRKNNTMIEHSLDLSQYSESLKMSETGTYAERDEVNKRVAALLGKVCKIYVGDSTTAGLRRLVDSVDDCLRSTLSAVKHGVVQGGGFTLFDITRGGNEVIHQAAKSYYEKIIDNAGIIPTGEFINIMPEYENILDSAGVVAGSLKNAWAGALNFLLSDAVLVREPKNG